MASPNGSPDAARDGDVIARFCESLSRVTHDVNNPLAIISGNAQLLREYAREVALDDDVVKAVRDIEEASERLAELLRGLSALKEEAAGYVAGAE